MPVSFFLLCSTAAALLCFTVLAGSHEDRLGSVDGRVTGDAYRRCGPRDECVCLEDDPLPMEKEGKEEGSGGWKAMCGGGGGEGDTVVSAIITELLQPRSRKQTPAGLVVVVDGDDEKRDGVTVGETTLPSFGKSPVDPDLGKRLDGNGDGNDTTVRMGQRINGGEDGVEVDEGEEKEIGVGRREEEDVDSIRTTVAAAEREEKGGWRTKIEQRRMGDELGPLSTIDQRSRSTDPVESGSGNSVQRIETTTSGSQVYPGSGPRRPCSFNNTVSLTLFGNYQEREVLACLNGLKRLSLQNRPLEKIDGKTFSGFQGFRLQQLQVTGSNVSTVFNGAFRAFRESLFSLDLSGNHLEIIDARSLSELPLLKTLNVSANRLQNASFILSAKSGSLSNLRILDLSRNAIESFSLSTEVDEMKATGAGQSRESRPERYVPVEREILRYLTTPERNPADVTTTSIFQSSIENSVTTKNGSMSTMESKFRNLQTIDLSMNRLTSLPNYSFVDLVELRELRLADNAITDIESDAFFLSNRYLTTETVTQRPTKGNDDDDDDTQEYYISSALCNYGWPNLQLVDLSHNNLSYIRDGALSGALCTVRRLVLSHNRIAQLPRYLVERLPYLEHIDLSHNELAWLDVGAFTNPSLISIGLAHNRLRKIISMTFLYLPAVTHIDLSHNGLVYLYKFAFYRLCSSSSGLSVTISLRSNQLQTDGVWKLMSTFQHLGHTNCNVRIDLSDNNVTRFLGDALDFINDRLAAADVQHFSHWSQVDIDLFDNQIHCDCGLVDDFRAMVRIYESISTPTTNASNSVRTTRSNLESWKLLWCSKVVSAGPRKKPMTVETYLRIADCDRDFCFEPCTCSRDDEGFAYSVNCSYLQLEELPAARVDLIPNTKALSRITSFDLTGNNLTSVKASFFRQMPAVEEIHLRKNNLNSVPLELLDLTGLRCLTLADNPLQCRCSDVWLQELFNRSTDIVQAIIQDWNELTCTLEDLEEEQVDVSIPRLKVGTGSKRQNINHVLIGNMSDLCRQNTIVSRLSKLNSTVISLYTEEDAINWVQLIVVSISLFLLVIAAVSIRGLKKWLRRRRNRKRTRGHGRSKVSSAARQGEPKFELLVYCDKTQRKWVRKKLVSPIRREFSHLEINVVVETLHSTTTRFRRDFPVDVDMHQRKADICRTTLILLSKDWVNRMVEHASEFKADDFVDLSSTSSAFVPTVLILTSKDVNISEVHALHCATEQFPCLEIDDPLFRSYLFQHMERSFRVENRPGNTNAAPLKLTKGRGYESIRENLRKY